MPRTKSKITAMAAGLLAASVVCPAAAAVLEPVPPAAVGMNPDGLDQLRADMKALVDGGRRAGVVFAVARHGKRVLLEAYGSRNREKNLPMTPETAFRLASLSRVLTGATALTLIDDGRLKMTDPVAKYIPEFAHTPVIKEVVTENGAEKVITEPQRTPLTVRHLFTYTGGFGYGTDWPKSLGMRQEAILGLDKTLAEGIRTLASYPLLNQPGAKWHYGFSGDVLGRVAEVASGQPLETFLRERMLDKLGMKDTGFWIKDADRLAEVYGPDDTGALVNKSAGPNNLSRFTAPGPMTSAGGGLVSTVPDYLRFAQMLLNGGELGGVRVLKRATAKAMITRQTTPEQGLVYWYDPKRYTAFTGYAWGYAIGVRVDDASHSVPGTLGDAGWAGFTNTWFFIDPTEDVVGVAMTQYLGPDDDKPVIAALRKGIYASLKPR